MTAYRLMQIIYTLTKPECLSLRVGNINFEKESRQKTLKIRPQNDIESEVNRKCGDIRSEIRKRKLKKNMKQSGTYRRNPNCQKLQKKLSKTERFLESKFAKKQTSPRPRGKK